MVVTVGPQHKGQAPFTDLSVPNHPVHGFNRYAYVSNNPYNFIDPDGLAPGDPFDSPEDAGEDAVQFINEKSIQNNKEYGGGINRKVSVDGEGNKTAKYVADQPKEGTKDSVPITGKASTLVGDYHTHGDYSTKTGKPTTKHKDAHNSDKWSYKDNSIRKQAAKATKEYRAEYGEKYTSVLGTPSGKVLVKERK